MVPALNGAYAKSPAGSGFQQLPGNSSEEEKSAKATSMNEVLC
jgi:hypothetical protein